MSFSESEIRAIEDMYAADCFRCQKDQHLSNHCTQFQKKKNTNFWEEVMISLKEAIFSECSRCGREHSSKDCNFTYHVYGYKLSL
jgi:hypothetical protein